MISLTFLLLNPPQIGPIYFLFEVPHCKLDFSLTIVFFLKKTRDKMTSIFLVVVIEIMLQMLLFEHDF